MLCPSVCPLLSQAYIRLQLFTAAFPTSPRGWLSSGDGLPLPISCMRTQRCGGLLKATQPGGIWGVKSERWWGSGAPLGHP